MNNEINQKIGTGAHDNNVVGTQNIYQGLSPEQACEVAINLFNDNFPKLQKIAQETAEQRASEFCQETVAALVKQNIDDFSMLSDPDIQYVLINAQKDYARVGTDELRKTLTSLVCKRVLATEDNTQKAVINNAIETAKYLSESHMDLLSLIFIAKHLSLGKIRQITDSNDRLAKLKDTLDEFAIVFSKASFITTGCLQNFNCLMLKLGTSEELLAKTYDLKESDVKTICPEIFKSIHPDYGLSYTGIALAITNIEIKLHAEFDMSIWIK